MWHRAIRWKPHQGGSVGCGICYRGHDDQRRCGTCYAGMLEGCADVQFSVEVSMIVSMDGGQGMGFWIRECLDGCKGNSVWMDAEEAV